MSSPARHPLTSGSVRPVSFLTIGPRYFNTLGATILAGRDFNDFDQASGGPVAIVNGAFRAPRGRRRGLGQAPANVRTMGPATHVGTVVGVTCSTLRRTRQIGRRMTP